MVKQFSFKINILVTIYQFKPYASYMSNRNAGIYMPLVINLKSKLTDHNLKLLKKIDDSSRILNGKTWEPKFPTGILCNNFKIYYNTIYETPVAKGN